MKQKWINLIYSQEIFQEKEKVFQRDKNIKFSEKRFVLLL